MPRKLRLATAIRKGVEADGPQVRGTLFRVNRKGKITGCCALGAAMIGVGLVDPAGTYDPYDDDAFDDGKLDRLITDGLKNVGSCPVKGCKNLFHNTDGNTLIELVPHLNDEHKWSRERIAEWAEGVK